MADKNPTIFQRLNSAFRGMGRNNVNPIYVSSKNDPLSDNPNRVLFTTSDKNEYEKKLNSFKQQKYLAYQWKKAGADNASENLSNYTAVKLMYRDADLMDGTCEIGTALDIISEEACPITSKGMLNISSRSPRVKSILEDLFVNRLHIYTELPMIERHMAKYGNTFMLLNIDKDNGVMGWMLLPIYEVDRIENGYGASYAAPIPASPNDISPDEVKFVWRGATTGDNVYRNWQIAHFRLLHDSFFLPYGVSMLHKARRAWRMWSMMEDAMLIWRLDKAIERRIFKIYVGSIDDQDVPAYIDEIANRFKRTAIVDPQTGQVDLRKNFLDISSDFFIPVRTENAPTPIETLQGANSQVQMEDIEYMQNKIFAALRVPKTFLNFKEAQGKSQNLSYMDVRFARMINRHQQFLLMELNKIAMIHLYVMGLQDEIGNFQLSLNNPTSQIEAQELEDLNKRVGILATVLADPGTGIPIMSMHRALRDIMKMSDTEIKDMLNEIRLEKAMAAELANTAAIIKKTGVFDTVDRIYGDYEAMNSDQPVKPQGQDDEMGGAGGGIGGGLGGDMGEMDDDSMMSGMGEPGGDEDGMVGGETGETDMSGAPDADAGTPLSEAVIKKAKKIRENRMPKKRSFIEQYLNMLDEDKKTEEPFDYDSKNATMEYQIKQVCNKIDEIIEKRDSKERNTLLEAAMNKVSEMSQEVPEDTVETE